MKVKIDGEVYDAESEPIMLILSDEDKKNIANMLSHCTKYCAFPKGMTEEEIKEFMRTN